jgi:hypothetical protein
MDDDVQQEAERVDENMPLAAREAKGVAGEEVAVVGEANEVLLQEAAGECHMVERSQSEAAIG